MAAAEAKISGTPSQTHAANFKMDSTPETLSPAQQEAQHILQHLLTKLQDPRSEYHSRYAKWIHRHPNLLSFCMDCVRAPVWKALEKGLDYNTMKSIAGDFPWQAGGIYFDTILSPPHSQPQTTRLYIGQSTNLRLRISQHQKFRYRRDNPSLHYHALHQSADNAYGTLILLPPREMGGHALPGMDNEALLLEVLEMWMCLVFGSLQGESLDKWMPVGVERRDGVGGLNVWCPVERWEGGSRRREMVDLRASGDALVREWGELKRGEWRERVVRELGLEEGKGESAGVVVEGAPPWVYVIGGAVGGAVVMWLYLGRVRGR